MNYAVLWVPGFALCSLQRHEPGLQGKPVALVTGEGRRAVVVEATREAQHVRPGLAVPLATSRCPGLLFRGRDLVAEQETMQLLVASAFTLSPRVECTSSGCVTVDLKGADAERTEAAMRLHVLELRMLGLPVQIGAGETPLVARYAAKVTDSIMIVRDRGGLLQPVPLSFAEPSARLAEILEGWGIRTLGALTTLPKAEIGGRLGPEGAALWERANGESPGVLTLTEPAKSFAASWRYEPPVESVEPLVFKLRRYAERIAAELRAVCMVAEELSLTLLLEDETDHLRQFRLPEPGADVDSWLRVLQTHLDSLRLDSRVAGVRLVAKPARPAQAQGGLFETGRTDAASFWENIARLAVLVGDDRVGTPVPLDTYAPDAFRMERPAIVVPAAEARPVHPPRGGLLRRFRPPLRVRVTCQGSSPVMVEGAVRGDIRARVGPIRLQGGWWMVAPWAFDTWLVELVDGGLYQLTHNAAGWAVEGVLD